MSTKNESHDIRLAPVGPVSETLAEELAPYIELTGQSSKEESGSLFDAARGVDRAALEEALRSRKPVVVARPNEEALAALLAITGQAPSGDLAAIIYKREEHGGFKSTVVQARSAKSKHVTPYPIGERLARALTGVDGCPVGDPPESLLANTGSLAGYSVQQVLALPVTMNPPQCSGKNDDTYIQKAQNVSVCANLGFYVYYVNGGQEPYFAVFVTLQSTTTCNPISKPNTNLGWFSARSELAITGPSAPVATSPQSGSAYDTTVFLADSFPLLGDTDAGANNPYQFNPSIQQQAQFEDWSYLQNGTATMPWWIVYQNTPWNPVYYTPGTYATWYDTNNVLFDPSWNVMTMTDMALSPYSWIVMGEWYVFPTTPQEPPYATAPSTPVTFVWDAAPHWSAVHNSTGCIGACTTTGDNHLFDYAQDYGDQSVSIDLGTVANLGNLTQQPSQLKTKKRSKA